ncbi:MULTISPECIES: TIGR02391 family protein [Halomicrobium]|uniref:Conserved hypothetical protein CHP02391 domain-containing protein n=2 Tax=Halomicrobium mukohataei TaxID=57705 RepID=C7P3Z6_HALMD|nr:MULTISPECIES: TIGR02391 family protein [Halomicrobium]ACV47818.1 hypothetical protein Hmuk_1704 [Halomicrobium mukohataei DSM 12286]QCD66266.1 hypothetical protein E5139_11655 [Halomicrobium mukohataei]QFR21072.1 hypothetical protein GBQ70_11650 [Halomicrobium sp. ZPS1]
MFINKVFTCQKIDSGEESGEEEAEVMIDDDSGSIDFQMSHYDVSETGKREAHDVEAQDIQRRTLERMLTVTSEWLDSDVKGSVSVNLGEVSGVYGQRGHEVAVGRERINFDLHVSVNDRGVWFGDQDLGLYKIPAGPKKDVNKNTYNNLYNIRQFRDLLEEFLYSYGRENRDDQDVGSFSYPTSELDDELIERVLPKYDRGNFGDAVQTAGKIVEERVRQKSPEELKEKDGSELIQEATKSGGPLSFGERSAEEQGVMFLYAGSYQAIRNPLSHRSPDQSKERYLDDLGKEEAHNIISFVNLQLRFLDQYASSP